MIGWLKGRIVDASATGAIIIDVNGIGYEVNLALVGTLSPDQDVELFIYTQVRADAIVLYGFATSADKEFFTTLLVTPGVGPSTALAALRTMPTEELRAAIESGDIKKVSQIPGIGAKTASRIVLELKGKLIETPHPVGAPPALRASDIEEALRSLGYSSSEIREGLQGVELPENESMALRAALQLLGRR